MLVGQVQVRFNIQTHRQEFHIWEIKTTESFLMNWSDIYDVLISEQSVFTSEQTGRVGVWMKLD